MLKPRVLSPGQTIGIIAPSSVISELGEDTIQKGYQYLKDRGFSIREGSFCRGTTSPENRARDINTFFADPEIACLMAFWGGRTATEVLDFLDYDLIKKSPKIIIGFSDITNITATITERTGLITFSGPGVISFAKPEPFEYTWDYFQKMCMSSADVSVLSSPTFADDPYYLRPDNNHRIIQHNPGLQIFRNGQIEGSVIGGHLLSLVELREKGCIGTFKGKILFAEFSEEESLESIEKTLADTKSLGVWDEIAGLVIGRFVASSNAERTLYETTVADSVASYGFPVLYNADFGHADPIFTIPHGGHVKINTETKSIVFSSATMS